LILGASVRTFRIRQTPQRQAGEASVRGSAEEAPEGHWGVVACSLPIEPRVGAALGSSRDRGHSARVGHYQSWHIHPSRVAKKHDSPGVTGLSGPTMRVVVVVGGSVVVVVGASVVVVFG